MSNSSGVETSNSAATWTMNNLMYFLDVKQMQLSRDLERQARAIIDVSVFKSSRKFIQIQSPAGTPGENFSSLGAKYFWCQSGTIRLFGYFIVMIKINSDISNPNIFVPFGYSYNPNIVRISVKPIRNIRTTQISILIDKSKM